MICFRIKKGEKYPESVRQFCLSLHYYSPRAYNYIREVANKHLPHSKTIQIWYANSDVSGEEGLSVENMEKLQRIVNEHKSKHPHSDLLCALVFDEMDIRQQIYWNRHIDDYDGFTNNTTESTDDLDLNDSLDPPDALDTQNPQNSNNVKRSKQAIVFILNGINYCLEFPVAYWIIQTLDKYQRKSILLNVIEAVTKAGVKIVNVTFDGYSSNVPMCELLGADLNIYSDNFQPYFFNPFDPSDNKKIYVLLDPCHMVKLVRNTLANKEIFYNADNREIRWCFFESLVEFSKENDFQTHKMNKKHLQWRRNMMNVRLAVETLSNSVANAMDFLIKNKHPQFTEADPTVEFIRIINNLFDVFNSRSLHNKEIFKCALNPANKRIIFDFLEKSVEYLKSLKVKIVNSKTGKYKVLPVLRSRNHTGFRGFIIDIYTLMQIYVENVEEKNMMVMVPTYSLLQDVIEMFFGRIRSMNGSNNNPNIQQFKGAYRKLLCNIKISAPEHGNCRIFSQLLPNNYTYSNIFTVSSARARITFESIEENYEKQKDHIIEDIIKVNELKVMDPLLNAASNYTISFMASRIEEAILAKNFECEKCLNVLNENEKVCEVEMNNSFRAPCRSTYNICKVTDQFLKVHDIRKSNKKYDFKVIYCLIYRSMDFNTLYKNSSFECDINHKYQFVKYIVKQYIDKKLAYLSKQITLEHYNKIVRQQFNKLVLSAGQ